jgi:hypothetical protein
VGVAAHPPVRGLGQGHLVEYVRHPPVRHAGHPPNDDFANATHVTAVPFNDTVDHLIAATVEPNEPLPCAGGAMLSTVWWAFTPSSNGSYSASLAGPLSPQFDAYTGSSLANLNLVACSSGGDITFKASAGTTYYLRAAGAFTLDFPMFFRLDVTPAPVAAFFFGPSDPSIFDSVQFLDASSDPGGWASSRKRGPSATAPRRRAAAPPTSTHEMGTTPWG